jgi:hypothetical protein
LAEERFPDGPNVYGDEMFKELLENFVVGVTQAFVPFDAVHGSFIGHRVEYDTIFGGLGFAGGDKAPKVVCKCGVECVMLLFKLHLAKVVEDKEEAV